jgi:hypothetical protein
MDWKKLLFQALLFAAFVPGVLVTLPPGGSRWVVLAVHGLLFAVVCKYLYRALFPKRR